MRRKRLNHIAFTLCHMFCGWRLAISYKEIAKLGSGTLIIDIPSARCHFNGEEIPTLSIAIELQFWFQSELTDNNIPAEGIISAELSVQLELNIIEREKRVTAVQFFSPDGKHIKSARILQYKIDCMSKIVTSETTYQRKFADIEEWPEELIEP